MIVEFLARFSKDIDSINQKSIKNNLIKVILSFETANSLNDISNLKKLSGHKSAYRVRIGDYRVGIFIDGNKAQFARIVHRKDIYKVFP
ncbi:MAG: type II toxin-antitoxin system RelE/ParE family toxin [Bacteroidota bacterium]